MGDAADDFMGAISSFVRAHAEKLAELQGYATEHVLAAGDEAVKDAYLIAAMRYAIAPLAPHVRAAMQYVEPVESDVHVLKIKARLSPSTEFEAEGSTAVVSAQFQAFLAAVAGKHLEMAVAERREETGETHDPHAKDE
jgi:hypothetical protein